MTRDDAMRALAQVVTRSTIPIPAVIRMATWRYRAELAKPAEDAKNAEKIARAR